MSPLTHRAAVLLALTEGPTFGWALGQRLKIKDGTLYPILRALERDRLIAPCGGPPSAPERGGRPRQYYQLTEAGYAQAEADRALLAALVRPESEE